MPVTFQQPQADFLRQFLAMMQARKEQGRNEQFQRELLDRQFEGQKEVAGYQDDLEKQKAAAIAEALGLWTEPGTVTDQRPVMDEFQPGMPQLGQTLGDMSGLAGVAGARDAEPVSGQVGPPSPEDQMRRQLERGVGVGQPKPQYQPGMAPTGMQEDYRRQRTTEEMLPMLEAKLRAARASESDIQGVFDRLGIRRDYNEAADGSGSPFQNMRKTALDSEMESRQDYSGSEDEVVSWAERLANGEISLTEIPRYPPTLRSGVNKYMSDNKLAIIPKEIRKQVAGVHKTKKMMDLFEEKWGMVEDAYTSGGKVEAILAYKDYTAAIKGNAAQFRQAVGESGQFTEADATRMIDLMTIGGPEALADLVDSSRDNPGPFAGRMRKRLSQTRESFTAGLDAQVRNYFGKLGEDGSGKVSLGGLQTSPNTGEPDAVMIYDPATDEFK